MNAIKNGIMWFLALSQVWGLIVVTLVMKSQVLYRTEIQFGDKTAQVSVLTQERLSYDTSESRFGFVELSESDGGQILRRTGIPAGRGHLPIITIKPASINEVALYRNFFPKGGKHVRM